MAEPTLRCCRCDEPMPRPTPLGNGLRGVTACPCCGLLVVSEQGENAHPDDRADPDEWGQAWT
jgi:hypothetical protein